MEEFLRYSTSVFKCSRARGEAGREPRPSQSGKMQTTPPCTRLWLWDGCGARRAGGAPLGLIGTVRPICIGLFETRDSYSTNFFWDPTVPDSHFYSILNG
jgi:hypothetical protein